MDAANEIAAKAVEALREHFHSVIIICTGYDGGEGTRVLCERRGNYYATKGAVTEWLEEERNRDLAEKLREDED